MHDRDGLENLGDGMTNEEIGRALVRIEAKVDKTNGRVTTMEMWRARIQGAWFVATLAGPVIAALLAHYIG